jgi:tripeptide aminopeptidase
MNVRDRFLQYVAYETTSDPESKTVPTTASQKDLGEFLVKELKTLGLDDARMNGLGYVYASLPGTVAGAPTIGLVAHMDTSPDYDAKDVKPQIIENYDGGDIHLGGNVYTRVADFPELADYKGWDLITTDGSTLLGADNKAGIAEIITAVEHLIAHPEIPRGEVKIAFTPDEEVGRGADHFDVPAFGADFAYTVDGGEIGELEYENFNAASGKIKINGRNIHPGNAKHKMKNALHIAMALDAMLPEGEKPVHTEGYEGFYHLNHLSGSVESAEMLYILRDHDREKFEEKKATLMAAAEYLNRRHGEGTVEVELEDSYYNMREKIMPVYEIVELAERAMQTVGVTLKIVPVRGGTDGARLSYMGLPCPNIFTGGHNFHGRHEYIPVQAMEKAVEVIVEIIRQNTESPVKAQ